MKKIMVITVSIILFAAFSFAADFVPTPMTLTGPEEIGYEFTGESLTISFTIEGTPAAVWLVINTKGMAEDIVDVRNGFLGWHYVNKIDTTIYISARQEREIGDADIVWDGTDQDGNIAAAGNYDYYLWAYDNVSNRVSVNNYIHIGSGWNSTMKNIYEVDEDGLPLAQPFIMGCRDVLSTFDNTPGIRHGDVRKWIIGNDPNDESLFQSTYCSLFPIRGTAYSPGGDNEDRGWELDDWIQQGGPVYDPNDYTIFYGGRHDRGPQTATIHKWTWVTDGEAVIDEDWGGYDNIEFVDRGNPRGHGAQPSVYTEREYLWMMLPGLWNLTDQWNKINCVSFDGDVIIDQKQMNEWYMPDDQSPQDIINGAPHHMVSNGNNQWFLLGHGSCLQEMIDVSRWLVDQDDDTDYIRFQNSNGDYFLDGGYKPDAEPAWYCNNTQEPQDMRRDQVNIDDNGFAIIAVGMLGLTSFGVMTQDGTGVDYMAFADEFNADDKRHKGAGRAMDYGSNYDGLYYGIVIPQDNSQYGWEGMTYCAFDSWHGVITNAPIIEPGVDGEQLAFSVAQNSPNPFNPTTSISFTLPAADHSTIEIYNVAGQKVDTLANDFMDAGKHSLVWDASGLSAGVYFYTVKSGDFSRTMKMTLLK